VDIAKLKVEPGDKFKLKNRRPDDTFGITRPHALKAMPPQVEKLSALHDLLYAEHKRSVLIVLQGMDASGKDGTIKHVMTGVNPQGCNVTSFKEPTTHELDHDYLWRIHAAVPAKGMVGIFNRSQYEDVLITKVHKMVPLKLIEKRYAEINAFEHMLSDNGVHILKFFLHMSSEEQLRRFESRLEDPHKNWKSSPADFKERQYFDQYQAAYEEVLDRCSTKHAPWYVIPADRKWFRNFAVAEVVVRTMESFGMKYPEPATPKMASSSVA
jgi:PPK2 family polyphosphate:nucleotide phosphotransferase